ncbi:sigma-54-dependent transcriptional regulator [Yoonia litorea]|uniref:Nif-specific regulatory protein n=1 Tax=Yoonia litorea TaxID=1123755 RepID=A0A1I6MV13_9RHOB|nr:sigma-54 dependent transcriptional regulator [Yoonia litorea]SFS19566.1 two-component system, NtrC family, C4-dicarboxylate transport response regulator DctD [Yoonia litorea]
MPDAFTAFVIDDDREMRDSLGVLLERAGWQVTRFQAASAALERLAALSPDVILSDVRMPAMSGMDLLDRLQGNEDPPLVLISAHADIPMAVDAIQKGAYSFLEKPFEPRRLLTIIRHAAEQHRLRRSAQQMRTQLVALSGLDRVLLGNSPAVTQLKQDAIDLAVAKGPVLITGQTGTGKEVVARALHRLGPRSERPFVALNCATLSADRMEEQVFGVVDGQQGVFRKSDGGTLFLDEVGTISIEVQAKLLRVLETSEFQPVGSDRDVRVDVRVIAASNEDLECRVAEGRFRSDFLYRLNTFHLHLPPLTERGDDIVFLFQHFVAQLSETYEIAPPELSADDAAALLAHDWPGNVRELRHVAERRVLAARRGGGSVAAALQNDSSHDDVPATLRDAVARFERTLIGQAIRSHEGRMDAVAEALGIGRRTLNEKIVKLGLEKSDFLN